MGKKLRDEDLKLNIIVNGDSAKRELGILEDKTKHLKDTNKQLRLEKSKLNKTDKNYRQELKRINTAIKENNVKIKENENRMSSLRIKIGLTGLTYSQLRREQQKLRIQLQNTTYGTPQWKRLNAELKKVENRMRKVRAGASRANFSMKKLSDGFNRYFGLITAGAAAITGVVFSIQQWVKGNVGLSDSLADVMKTTGMTRKQVRGLYTEFKYLNTRTPRRELLALAEEAGRLGKKSKKDVMDFVEVANQIKVALGDDLGGNAEVAIREVGKLTEIFGVGEKYGVDFRKSMLMVGSSINEVSANSQAQAPYLIDMMKRLAGVATQAKISSDQVIGYAAVLDEKGQKVEMASTAMGKAIISMFSDTEEYAGIAQMKVDDFTQLLNSDANEAFLKVLEGLQGNNEGLSVMAAKLDALGIDGSRAIQVLASLASSTDKIRDRQVLANKSLVEATSLTNEYNVKNENLAGNVERLGRAIRAKFVNSELIGWLEKVVGWMVKWTEVKISDKLEKERIKVQVLVTEWKNSNTTMERSKEIYEELNELAPEIVEGLNAENLELEKLNTNWSKYNDNMINKIAIQRSEEDLEEKMEEVAKERRERAEAEVELTEDLIRFKEKAESLDADAGRKMQGILDKQIDVVDKAKEILKIREEETIWSAKLSRLQDNVWSSQKRVEKNRKQEIESNDLLQQQISQHKKTYETIYDVTSDQIEKVKNLGDEEKSRLIELNEQLTNLQAEQANIKLFGGSYEEITALQSKIDELKKQIEDLKNFDPSTGGGKTYQELLDTIKKNLQSQQDILQQQLSAETITHEEYREKLLRAELNSLEERKNAAIKFGEDTVEIEKQIAEKKEEVEKLGNDKGKKSAEELTKALKKEYDRRIIKLKEQRAEDLITEEEYRIQLELMEMAHLEAMKTMKQQAGEDVADIEKQILDKQIEFLNNSQESQREFLQSIIDESESEIAAIGDQLMADMEEDLAVMTKSEEALHEKRMQNLKEEDEAILQKIQMYQSMMKQFSSAITNIVQGAMDNNQDMIRGALKNTALMLLEMLKLKTQMAIAGVTIDSLTSKESLATWGIAGIAKAALLVGLIEAAFAGVKGVVQGAFSSEQAYKGKYPVRGKDDGKLYQADRIQDPGTGLLPGPTLLAGELPEIIIDPATTKNLQMNYPGVIQAINAARVPQYAKGSYPRELVRENNTYEKAVMDPAMMELLKENVTAIRELRQKGVLAKVVKDYETSRDLHELLDDYDETLNNANL